MLDAKRKEELMGEVQSMQNSLERIAHAYDTQATFPQHEEIAPTLDAMYDLIDKLGDIVK